MLGAISDDLKQEAAFNERKTGRFFAVLLAIAVIYLWLLPIHSSFSLDETGTFWIIKDGVGNLITRSLDWAGQSPLYYLTAWPAFLAGGRREWVLRLPSLAALVIALWVFRGLARDLFDVPTARWAMLMFACSEPIAFAASDARPYALGLCLTVASAWMLVRWLGSGHNSYYAGYVLLSALTLYTHYLFGPALAVLGLYGLWCARKDKIVSILSLFGAWILVGILMSPLVPQLSRFYESRTRHSFAGPPGVGDLLSSLAPPGLVASLLAGIFLAWWFCHPLRCRSTARKENVFLAIGWALTPPLLLFAISGFTGVELFVPRYYISCIPGLCLAAAWIVRSLVEGPGERIVGASVVLIAIVSFASVHHRIENWSDAMRKVQSLAGRSEMPVLIPSGFVEATDAQALTNPKLREVLFAPQVMYPPGGRLVPLPYRLDEESATYIEHLLPSLEQHDRFVLVVRFEGVMFEPWLQGRLSQAGFHAENLGDFGAIGVFLFHR